MGLFKKIQEFQSKRKERQIEKAQKTVANPKAIKEDRMMALQFLADVDDPERAIPALLKRFDYSLEHGIIDAREKEVALKGIVKYGDRAVPLVKEHLRQTTHIAWPIKILMELCSEEDMREILVSCLDYGDIMFNQAKVDKNYDLLCYLIDYKDPSLPERLYHFLNDSDERVRFACVEVLVNQDDQPGLKEKLEPFLLDDSSENRRIRAAVIEAFIDKHWRVSDVKAFPSGPLVEGVFVTKKGHLERRN